MISITAVIPAYNAARYLRPAVESVLGQSVTAMEVVVVDDGSADDTPSVMDRFGPPVRYIRQPNAGVAVARNRGIAEARGRYVAFLDADDLWEPEKLDRQLAALQAAGGKARACSTAYLAVTDQLAPVHVCRNQHSTAPLKELLTRGNIVGTPSTVLVERALLNEVGGFDPALSQCADWDLWIRLAVVTEFAYVDEPLVRYRVHDQNMSRNIPLLERDSGRVLEKAFTMPGLPPGLRALRRNATARNEMVLAGCYYRAGWYGNFLRCATQALTTDPRQFGHLAAFPARLWGRWRNSEGAAGG